MTYPLVIRGGLCVTGAHVEAVDVAVASGKIVCIGPSLSGEREIDASGLVVFPGMVDAHVHITEPGGGVRDGWEGYVTGTSAAAKGGVTTAIEMPLNQIPATVDGASLEAKISAAQGKLKIDVASLGGLVPYNLDGGIFEQAERGVVGFKAFLSTCGDRSISGDFQDVDDWSLYRGMLQIAQTGLVLDLHCENAAITDGLGRAAKAAGKKSLADYVATRPVFTEVEAVRRAILLARETGVALNICHCSCVEAVLEVEKARSEGLDVTCETCPHYLVFSTDELDAIGMSAKCSPPIRDARQREGLWDLIREGKIDFIVSDHSPCTPDLKATDNAFDAWGGVAGLQSSVETMFDEGYLKRNVPLPVLARLLAENPAKRCGLEQKGSIAIGKDADIVLIDPHAKHVLAAEDLEYRNKISPYVGREFSSRVVGTFVRGHLVYSADTGVTTDFPGKVCEVIGNTI